MSPGLTHVVVSLLSAMAASVRWVTRSLNVRWKSARLDASTVLSEVREKAGGETEGPNEGRAELAGAERGERFPPKRPRAGRDRGEE